MISGANGGVVDPTAGILSTPCEDSNGNEGTAEENVKDNAEQGEACDAAKEAGQDDSEGGIDHGSSGHALNCLLPSWNHSVAAAS
jgi:hypothetical protein